jgi:SAM-dependent methyltransferase
MGRMPNDHNPPAGSPPGSSRWRILDAGCGAGPLFAALRDRGAIVTGIDKSAGMVGLARRRLGDDTDLQVAELGRPLPFPDDTFDDVTASLVLH